MAAADFKKLVKAIYLARRKRRGVIFMLGAHVIKCGLSPLIIDLMKRRFITHVALNGAGIIHDTEIAMAGSTSEEVAAGLKHGSFGMAQETAVFINEAINQGFKEGLGIGVAVGKKIFRDNLPNRNLSILSSGYKLHCPVSVHIAIGTDIIHQHPSCDGEATGEGSLIEFKNLIYSVRNLNQGGVCINFGSAVILPEVFLKALNLARNLGNRVANFTTANFDMVKHYRPMQNVVCRPTLDSGKGYNFIGHHEIMMPLLYRSILQSRGS